MKSNLRLHSNKFIYFLFCRTKNTGCTIDIAIRNTTLTILAEDNSHGDNLSMDPLPTIKTDGEFCLAV